MADRKLVRPKVKRKCITRGANESIKTYGTKNTVSELKALRSQGFLTPHVLALGVEKAKAIVKSRLKYADKIGGIPAFYWKKSGNRSVSEVYLVSEPGMKKSIELIYIVGMEKSGPVKLLVYYKKNQYNRPETLTMELYKAQVELELKHEFGI